MSQKTVWLLTLILLLSSATAGLLPAQNARKWIKKGDKAANLDARLRYYQQAIDAEPRNPAGYASLGQALYSRGEHDAALQSFDRAIGLDPDNADLFLARGKIHLFREAYSDARDDLQKARSLNANDPEAQFQYGLACYHLRDWDLARKAFTQVIGLDPENADAYHYRGLVQRALENYPAALEDHTAALRLQPESARDHCARASIWLGMGMYDKSNSELDRALALDPGNPQFLNLLSLLQFRVGNPEVALKTISRVIRQHPEEAEYYHARGSFHADMQQPALALPDLQKATALEPDEALYWLHLAGVIQDLGDTLASLEYFEKSANVDPAFSAPRVFAGQIKRRRGYYDAAVQHYNEAIGIAGKYYNERAWARIALGQFAESLPDLDLAIDQYPEEPFAYNNRGLLRLRMGQPAAALPDFAASLQRDNPMPWLVLTNRGEAYQALQQLDSARSSYQQALQLKPDCARASLLLARLDQQLSDPEFPQSLPRTWLFALIGEHEQATAAHQNIQDLADLYRLRGMSSPASTHLLAGPSLNRKQVLDSLREIFASGRGIRPQDQVVFLYSGYAGSQAGQSGIFLRAGGQAEDFISDAAIRGILDRSPARTQVALLETFSTSEATAQDSAPPAGPSQVTWIASHSNIHRRGMQYVEESRMTFFVLAGLRRAADLRRDGVIYLEELQEYLAMMLEYETQGRQRVQITPGGDGKVVLMLPD